MFVELEGASNDTAIVLETAVPIGVAEHEIGRAVGATFVGCMKKSPKKWLQLERIEKVSGRRITISLECFLARVQADERKIKGGQILKAAIAVAQIDVVRIRLKAGVDAVLRSPEALALWHIQRMQDECIHDPENDCVCANGQRQREYRDQGEDGGLAEHPESQAQVLNKNVEEMSAHGLVTFLFVLFLDAEFDTRSSFSLRARQASTLQILGAQFDVRTDFLLHFIGDSRPVKKFSRKRTDIGQSLHFFLRWHSSTEAGG